MGHAHRPLVENLSGQCDGHRRSFSINEKPIPDTVEVTLDGLMLEKNSEKGFVCVGKIITLGAAVPPPNGYRALLVAKYLPLQIIM